MTPSAETTRVYINRVPTHPLSKVYSSANNYTTRTTYYSYPILPAPPPPPPPPPQRAASYPPTATNPYLAHRAPQAHFGPVPATVSRLPRDDEVCVMRRFARHASRCADCAHPYMVHKTGGTLCPKGYQHALLVTEYVIAKEGKPHSVIDLDDNKLVEIEIPPECGAVRELLKALERGLKLRRKTPVISYDETYPVRPRVKPTAYYDDHDTYTIAPKATMTPKHTDRPRERRRSPVIETVEPSTLRRTKSERENKAYRGRGSLYEADMKEKERLRRQQDRRSTYYAVGDRGVREFHY